MARLLGPPPQRGRPQATGRSDAGLTRRSPSVSQIECSRDSSSFGWKRDGHNYGLLRVRGMARLLGNHRNLVGTALLPRDNTKPLSGHSAPCLETLYSQMAMGEGKLPQDKATHYGHNSGADNDHLLAPSSVPPQANDSGGIRTESHAYRADNHDCHDDKGDSQRNIHLHSDGKPGHSHRTWELPELQPYLRTLGQVRR